MDTVGVQVNVRFAGWVVVTLRNSRVFVTLKLEPVYGYRVFGRGCFHKSLPLTSSTQLRTLNRIGKAVRFGAVVLVRCGGYVASNVYV